MKHFISLGAGFILLSVYSQLADADCYPGDSQFTTIVQEVYKKVTSDRISGLRGYGFHELTRVQLCSLLVQNHNSGLIQSKGQTRTNSNFLGQAITLGACVNALIYTKGYDTDEGWRRWAGSLSGTWWSNDGSISDGAEWHQPYWKNGQTYAVQKVEFLSEWREKNCKFVDQTGATCKFGWNQSGRGIQYVWGWDPKDDICPYGSERGRTGAHVGFTFTEGSASCIVWVTTEEAFLECVRNFHSHKRRTSCNHENSGYGQWYIN